MSEEQALQEALEAAKAAHFDDDGAVRDYGVLCTSSEHLRIVRCLADLADFDFTRVRIPAQTAFWLNVFNATVLRDVAELAQAERVREVEEFFETPRVRIARFGYSLDDIQHGLLRGNVPKFGRRHAPMERDDPRLSLTPLVFEERTHFGLYSATRSSPALRVFDAGRLDRDLEDATRHYLRREVRVEEEGAVVTLPRQFYWYAADFGGGQDALGFALARLDDETVERVDRWRGKVKVRYADFDWSLDRK
ncbi:MAG TPA: DUF547 domain-containing protein [Burkholderiales bacterium]